MKEQMYLFSTNNESAYLWFNANVFFFNKLSIINDYSLWFNELRQKNKQTKKTNPVYFVRPNDMSSRPWALQKEWKD